MHEHQFDSVALMRDADGPHRTQAVRLPVSDCDIHMPRAEAKRTVVPVLGPHCLQWDVLAAASAPKGRSPALS